ncbi:MAG: MFS transporter [Chloroflexota bacterium]
MSSSSEALARESPFVRANLRRNVLAVAGEMGFFGLGLSLAAATTVLPAFARHLGASNLVIGALPAIMTVGWSLPSLLSANYVERRGRLLPLVLGVTIWERVPYLLMALAAAWFALAQPQLSLALTLGFFALAAFTGGLFMPMWMALIGKCIPGRTRGRTFALGHTASGLAGVAGAVLSGYLLGSFAFPTGYVLCFVAAFGGFAASFVCLLFVREETVPVSKPRLSLLAYFRRLPAVLRGNRPFCTYLMARALTLVGTMGNGFYTVYALSRLGAGDEQVGVFTFFLMATQTASTMLWGQVADRRGHRLVLTLGALATVLGNALALGASEVWHLYPVFALLGAATGSLNISHYNIVLEYCSPEDRPTFIGLSGTTMAPFALLAPLAGGLLADNMGFGAVFGAAAVAAALSWLSLAFFVRPARAPAPRC